MRDRMSLFSCMMWGCESPCGGRSGAGRLMTVVYAPNLVCAWSPSHRIFMHALSRLCRARSSFTRAESARQSVITYAARQPRHTRRHGLARAGVRLVASHHAPTGPRRHTASQSGTHALATLPSASLTSIHTFTTRRHTHTSTRHTRPLSARGSFPPPAASR